jgi:putative Mn2+ efflux pump MntP
LRISGDNGRLLSNALVTAGLILPLALDTFALGAALGVAGIPAERRLRTSLVLAGFEADVLGYFAGWTAIAFLLVAGSLMLRPGGEDKENGRLRLLARAQGFAIIDLGLAISVDELAIGFTLGLLSIPLVVAIVWIGAQALLAAQLGLRLGSRIGEALRERAEQLAGVVLIGTAGVLVVLKLVHGDV